SHTSHGDTMNQYCIKAIVAGEVQGVSFRAYTQREAERLGLTGYARNLPDGRVEVLACGIEDQIQSLLTWLQQGSPLAKVTEVTTEIQAWQPLDSFTTG